MEGVAWGVVGGGCVCEGGIDDERDFARDAELPQGVGRGYHPAPINSLPPLPET